MRAEELIRSTTQTISEFSYLQPLCIRGNNYPSTTDELGLGGGS